MCLQFVHLTVQKVDATFQSSEERVFLLFDNSADELLLSLEFREGIAHLLHQYWQQTEQECFFLSEEGVGIAYGAAQDTSDNISSLCIGWQLTVGYGECYGTQVVGTYAHSNVDVVLSR